MLYAILSHLIPPPALGMDTVRATIFTSAEIEAESDQRHTVSKWHTRDLCPVLSFLRVYTRGWQTITLGSNLACFLSCK